MGAGGAWGQSEDRQGMSALLKIVGVVLNELSGANAKFGLIKLNVFES